MLQTVQQISTTTWMFQEVGERLGLVGDNPNISRLEVGEITHLPTIVPESLGYPSTRQTFSQKAKVYPYPEKREHFGATLRPDHHWVVFSGGQSFRPQKTQRIPGLKSTGMSMVLSNRVITPI